ncbi:unnamed protein product [Oppiella nova]|uniref:Aminopeptidase n=1 Tax=Oppiella nova TaxID=334625 RepID=A0A7R9QPU8_9ACAR|nr:unnamed protein product [Oppiella nova]CAG2169365.1 unnamed protein product [Oppiella nova]
MSDEELYDVSSTSIGTHLPQNISQLIGDAFYLAFNGLIDYEIALNLTKYLAFDGSVNSWTTAQTVFSNIKPFIISDVKIALNYYVSDIIGKQYKTLGWDDYEGSGDHQKVLLQSLVLDIACEYEMLECLQTSRQKFIEWKTDTNYKITTNLLPIILKYGIQDINKYLYIKSTETNEKLLSKASDEKLIQKEDYLQFLINITLNSEPHVADIVFQFFDNYSNDNLFKDKALVVLDNNIAWIDRYKAPVVEWITNQCPNEVCVWHDFRLNPQVIPLQYYLTLRIDVNNDVFSGSVDIDVSVDKDIEYFVVHSANKLKIISTNVTINGTGAQLPIRQTFHYSPNDYFIIQLANKSTPNTYRLKFAFESILTNDWNSGLYKISYEYNGETIGAAATQLWPENTRKVFPCFDDILFKSRFDITLIHESVMNTTLTNMPAIDTRPNTPAPGWTTTKYQNSVSMVTYLVAIIVSDFVCHSIDRNITGMGYDTRVCATRPMEYKLGYATQTVPKVFHVFEDYLGVKYSLPKSDLVAVPDFMGGMENWGLVTFDESSLLWTPNEDTSANKMNVNLFISHELAHMWFGNLVTCHTWAHFWLNEGFASFMQNVGINGTESQWDYWDLFINNTLSSAIKGDIVESSPPIIQPVLKYSDMIFSSAILYDKGSVVIRMLEFVMGKHAFRDGIQKYIKQYAYKSVITENLWDSLNATFPKVHVVELMDNWTTKPGFPYITIKRDPQNPNTITITQERGMYFIDYTLEEWNKWITALVTNEDNIVDKLTANERSEFILETFYLSKANKLSVIKPLELCQYLVNETHFTPWAVFNTILGWDDREGTDTHKRMRGLVIEMSCGNGYQKCMEESYKEFTKWKSGQPLPPNLMTYILSFGLKYSNNFEDFEYTRDTKLLNELLERSVNNSSVSETHFSSLLSDLSSNSYALPIVENFLNLYPNTGLTNESRVNGLTKIQQNIDWIQHNADTIGQWLRDNRLI